MRRARPRPRSQPRRRAELACSSASAREQARSCAGTSSASPLGEHPASSSASAPDGVARLGRGREQRVEAPEARRRGGDPVLERALAVRSQQRLDPPGAAAARSAASRTAVDLGRRASASLAARARARAPRSRRRAPIRRRSSPVLHRVVVAVGLRRPRRRGAERGALALELRGQLGAAARRAPRRGRSAARGPRGAAVSRPQTVVRSRSRSARRSSISLRRRFDLGRARPRPSARASRASAAALSAPGELARRGAKLARREAAAQLPDSRSSRAWMSAAWAWRFSGRRRLRASRSTSRARSRLSWVRSSFSWARRRRLRCLPRPAASSTSRRRSRGLEWTISSTRPWLITECISRPRLASARVSITSTSRQRAPLSRYSPSPFRSSRRLIDNLRKARLLVPRRRGVVAG